MFRHIFRLIWNKKKSHSLLIVEILASFLVLFGVISLIIYNLRNYTEPIGYQYERVWVANINSNGTPDSLYKPLLQRIKSRVQAYPQVEAVGLMSSNTPFSMNQMNATAAFNGTRAMTDILYADQGLARTLEMPVREGRWFNKADDAAGAHAAVLNQTLKQALFGNEKALGKTIEAEGRRYKVVGVLGSYKPRGEYQDNESSLFLHSADQSLNYYPSMLFRVKPGTDAAFEAQLVKDFGTFTKDWNLEVEYLTDKRRSRHNLVLVPIVIFLVVSSFLLINVALGLFGVLNMSIARRRGEIGLRRAVGATGNAITRQFVGEMWALATLGMLIGLLFAVQFPLLNVFDLEAGVYLWAMLASVGVIYLIVTLCALYPSRQAAAIQPATALHEE